jgi:hypothetical protein
VPVRWIKENSISLIASKKKRRGSLYHRRMCACFAQFLRDIMGLPRQLGCQPNLVKAQGYIQHTRVSSADNNGPLSRPILRILVLGRMGNRATKFLDSIDFWNPGDTTI